MEGSDFPLLRRSVDFICQVCFCGFEATSGCDVNPLVRSPINLARFNGAVNHPGLTHLWSNRYALWTVFANSDRVARLSDRPVRSECFSTCEDRPRVAVQSVMGVGLRFACRMSAVSPTTRNRRRYRSPCFEKPPKRVLAPVDYCCGGSPSHLKNCLPERN